MKLFAVGVEPVGIIAIGVLPTGIVAIGAVATGVVAVGQVARGMFAIGQLALGVFSFGQLSAGAIWAGGQLAVGGTTSVAMLGYGAIGRWVPWRLEPVEIRPARNRVTLAARVVLFLGLVALVTFLAVRPVMDAIAGSGKTLR